MLHGNDEQDEGEDSPSHQEETEIVGSEVESRVASHEIGVFAEDNHQAERYPEGSVAGKGTKAEVVAGLELHQPGDHLSGTAKTETKPQNRGDTAPTKVVTLKNKGGYTESGQTDNGGIS